MKSEKMVEAGKKAWKTRRANALSETRMAAGRKAAITKLKTKISDVILSSSDIKTAEQKVRDVLERSPQMQ